MPINIDGHILDQSTRHRNIWGLTVAPLIRIESTPPTGADTNQDKTFLKIKDHNYDM